MTADTIVANLYSGAVPLIVGTVLLLLVRLGAHPALAPQWSRVPAAWRPIVPAAIGCVSAIADALVSGRSWLASVLLGLVSAGPAVLYALPSPVTPGRTVVVERLPDGSATIEREP